MLEHLPAWLGHAMRGWRAGADKIAIAQPGLATDARLSLSSPAFADGGRLPPRFTADGEGVSPPLVWGDVPVGTTRLALLVEDPDAPAPQPLVHAVVWGLAPHAGRLAEGEIVADGKGEGDRDIGRNSFGREGWLPPDPPTGHGDHRYMFQLFALGAGADGPGDDPNRSALVKAMDGHVLAAGLLIGIYSRGESAVVTGNGALAIG